MCWVMISTKFAVVQWESSVGGSPSTATFSTPPLLGVCARASSPVMVTRPATSSSDKPDRNPRLMANPPSGSGVAICRPREPARPSHEQRQGLLDEVGEVAEELGTAGAVEGPVVAGQG